MAEKKSNTNALFGVIALLVIVLAVAVFLLINERNELKVVSADLAEKTAFFRMEKDSLEGELRDIYYRYDTLETNSIELQVEMKQQQEKIGKLMTMQAEDAYKIKMYRKEMNTLRTVLRSYIVQIDSLNLQNQELLAENKQLRNTELRLSTEKEQLEQDKSQLEEIKSMASTLQASDMNLVLLNKRQKESSRIRTAVKVRVDFTIRANKVIEAGEKHISLRIIRPDEIVLGSPDLEMITFNEEEIPVSASRVVNYENEDLPVSIFWTNDGEIVPGEHTIELFSDGKIIGKSSFLLN